MNSALEIAQAVRERRLTPSEVVEEHLALIDDEQIVAPAGGEGTILGLASQLDGAATKS